ncbi:MAG: tetratricopeptide repeat protein [Elusimicrobia bacterium]|nr:tetratricopeptide repeat protein [Elusimicrobiota bacterium]
MPETALARAERLFASQGEARSYLTSLIGAAPGAHKAWREILACCRKARPEAAVLRLQGRALAFLGQSGPALSALDQAVALEPESAPGWAWRGEARLLAGMGPEAAADLDRAVELDPAWPWARLLRAVGRLTMGDTAGAQSDLAPVLSDPRAKECALGLRALLEGQNGDPAKGVRLLAGAQTSGFLFAVRGVLRRGLQDFNGSLEDLNKAAQMEATPWVYSQRADVYNRAGFFREALKDLEKVSELLPDSAQPHAQAANVYFDQAFYPEALSELEKAVERSPADPVLMSRRARFFLVLGRLKDAEADLKRVAKLDSQNGQVRFELLQVLALQNRFSEVLSEINQGALAPPYDDYLRGYVACRRGRYQKAEKHFLSAAKGAEGSFNERVRFYALVARVLGAPAPKTAKAPQFYLCGIGLHHPYQITVEILHALNSCEVLYNNLGDPQVSEFLGLFRAEVRAVTRVPGEPAMGRVRRIIAGFKKGRPTGFVTRIHPFIYRRIANDLVTACREKGISFHSFGAVSLTEISWALGSSVAGAPVGPMGARVFDMCWLNDHPELLESRYHMVVYCIAGSEHRSRLHTLLLKRYPPKHTVYLLAGSGDKEQEVVGHELRTFRQPLLNADLGAVLYAPPRA